MRRSSYSGWLTICSLAKSGASADGAPLLQPASALEVGSGGLQDALVTGAEGHHSPSALTFGRLYYLRPPCLNGIFNGVVLWLPRRRFCTAPPRQCAQTLKDALSIGAAGLHSPTPLSFKCLYYLRPPCLNGIFTGVVV